MDSVRTRVTNLRPLLTPRCNSDSNVGFLAEKVRWDVPARSFVFGPTEILLAEFLLFADFKIGQLDLHDVTLGPFEQDVVWFEVFMDLAYLRCTDVVKQQQSDPAPFCRCRAYLCFSILRRNHASSRHRVPLRYNWKAIKVISYRATFTLYKKNFTRFCNREHYEKLANKLIWVAL